MTLTAVDGYTFKNAKGNISTVTYGKTSADEDNAASSGTAVEKDKITLNDDGTLTVCVGAFTTATRKTDSVTAPEVPKQFANYYTAETVLGESNTEMSGVAKVTLEGTNTPNPVDMTVTWEVVDTDGKATNYEATPEATNTFRWTVQESEYKDKYDVSALTEKEPNPFTGMVTIKNKGYTPVTITGKDKKLTYDGSKTLDVSKYFTIDGNAGKATYELLGTSTGKGEINDNILTMNTLGTFVIKVSTPINGVYDKGEHTLTLTIEKAEIAPGAPAVGTKSTSDDGTATYKVTTSALTNGAVTYVAPANKKSATVIIPDTVVIDGVTYKVTAVEKNAFKNNKYIKKLIIGNNVKTIGKSAFAGCKKLKTVKFGKSVTTISDKAFYKCAALTKIIIPSKVKTIGKEAFSGCKKLKSVTIGKSVSKIGAKAFYGCKELKSINIKTKKLTTKKVGKNAFKGVGSKYYKKVVVKVPSKKYVNKYKKMLQSRGLSKKAKIKK